MNPFSRAPAKREPLSAAQLHQEYLDEVFRYVSRRLARREDVRDLNGRGLAMAAGRVAVNGQVRPRRADGSGNWDVPPTGSETRTYAVDADKGLLVFPQTGSNFGSAIALSGDGTRIAFGDAGHTISVRDARNNRVLATLVGHYSGISQLAFSPDGQRLVSADLKGKTFEWKLD